MDIQYTDKLAYCINCGKEGHNSKKCLCPIISLGIICIKINLEDFDLNSIITYSKKIQNNYLFSIDEINKLKKLKKKLEVFNLNENIEYLLIRRKNSLNYVEFIRGKYDVNNIDYLIKSFNFITIDEREFIRNNEFNILWKNLWGIDDNNSEYKESSEKFNLLKNGIIIKKNEINIEINLDKLINNNIYNFVEPEWGFPKGRRNLKEKNIECAKREFEEETNINSNEINIINMTPLEETYLASNNLKYRHIYYVSQIKDKKKILEINIDNISQKIEIGDIKWFKLNDALLHIRDYNIEKKNILINLHSLIKYTIDNLKISLDNFFNFQKSYN
jgi:8-oxo-dGTP pyrophosphatase MutT (NUDIX family)